MAESLRVEGLAKSYAGRPVLRGVSFRVAAGEVFALLGRSGSGKSTTLQLIAGLERPDAGRICFGEREVSGPRIHWAPEDRRIGMVFQEQLLWPHLTVREHLRLVLSCRGVPRREWAARMGNQLEAVQLTGREGAWPAQLSGGERQRLGLARALVGEPQLLLLDEPCASLDTVLRGEVVRLLQRLRERQRFTAVYVTHDAAEAFALADRIGVLADGELLQEGVAEELRRNPSSPQVRCLLENPFGGLDRGAG